MEFSQENTNILDLFHWNSPFITDVVIDSMDSLTFCPGYHILRFSYQINNL